MLALKNHEKGSNCGIVVLKMKNKEMKLLIRMYLREMSSGMMVVVAKIVAKIMI